MKYLLSILCIVFINFSILLSFPKPDDISIGMSETMGIYGFLNANYNIKSIEPFFITAGTFVIPTTGGLGLGWKRNYNQSRFSFFTAASLLGIYILPALCSTDDCNTKFDLLLSASAGLNINLLKKKHFDFYCNLGIIKQHSFFDRAIDESPSDIPGIWPVVNMKIILK